MKYIKTFCERDTHMKYVLIKLWLLFIYRFYIFRKNQHKKNTGKELKELTYEI